MNLSKTASLYGIRSNGGFHGDVFTSPMVVRYMLDIVGYNVNSDLRNIRILEPSCGEGEFVIEIAHRLLHSAALYHFDANEAFQRNVRAYDIDERKIEHCRKRLTDIGISPSGKNLQVANFLKCKAEKTDIVVGNPPYIRYENIPKDMRDFCRCNYSTFHYRCDLYVPFFEKTLSLLSESGCHCFICSNRWLKNEYGKKLRHLIAKKYALKMIIDLEQSDAFQEEVLAYPSITVIKADKPSNKISYGEVRKVDELPNLQISKRDIPTDDDWTNIFSSISTNDTFKTIEQQGFKIGIGAATGADAVFVSCDLPEKVETELILPSINARDLRGNQFNWHGDFIFEEENKNNEQLMDDLEKYFLSEKVKKYVLSTGTKGFYSKPETDLDIARPLLQSMHKMHRAGVDNYVTTNGRLRKLTPRECLRLMGFCDSFKIVVSDTAAYQQSGNSIVVDVLINILKEIIKAYPEFLGGNKDE